MRCTTRNRWFPPSRAAAVLVMAAALVGAARVAPAQEQGQLFMSALDPKGQPITDLQPSDVQILVDDIACRIVKLEPVNKPMKLTLMVDNGPGNSSALANLRTAVKNFIQEIPPDVSIEILSIAPQPRYLTKYTTDRDTLIKAVDRLSPDSGTGLFFDALVEAGNRVDREKSKEKSEAAYVLVMLASTVGRNDSAMERDYNKLQKQIVQHGITIHFVLLNSGGESVGSVSGALQTQVGLAVTKLSRGRYENIAASTRLVTLMPEMAKQIAESNTRQTHQYRITYQYPPGKDPKAVQKFQASLSAQRAGANAVLSLDGNMPVGGTQ